MSNLPNRDAMSAVVAQTFALMAERSGGTVRQDGELLMYRTPVPDPVVWNGALLLTAPRDPAHLLERADTFFTDRESYGFWIVGSEDAAMAELLERSGAPVIDDAPLMVAATNSIAAPPSTNVTLEIVDDERGRQALVAVCAAAFETIGATATSWPTVYPNLKSVHAPDTVAVVAIRDSRPIAAGMGYVHADLCEVIHIGTLPEARRQGVGAAVTATIVSAARDRGARHAILQATEFGENVYRGLGFVEVDRFRLHLRQPLTDAS